MFICTIIINTSPLNSFAEIKRKTTMSTKMAHLPTDNQAKKQGLLYHIH